MTPATSSLPGDRPTGRLYATRSRVLARNGVIATSHPLATAAGLQVLQAGGNAIDAAVTAAAVLGVVEPTMTGVGGDLFALVREGRTGAVRGLNSSGCAGAAADPAPLRQRGLTALPVHGPLSVTVPGSVAGWAALLQELGTRSLADALTPAIRYADEGFPVSDIVAGQWRDAAPRIETDAEAARVLLPGGRAPRAGEIVRNPDLARTLQTIAATGPGAVYGGPIGEAIAHHVRAAGGFLTAADLQAHRAEWVAPLRTTYRGYAVCELPPNTQGFVALEMLNILEGYDIAAMGHNSAECLHRYTEAARVAFADRAAYLADSRFVPADLLTRLIDKDYAAERRAGIDGRRAPAYPPASRAAGAAPPVVARSAAAAPRGDTVYLAAADRHGNVVSLINSLFDSFGSGLVVPGTGIALHSRGSAFSLADGHPNCLAPGKRPFHTLAPALLLKEGESVMAFGVMGGDNQGQAHVQIVMNVVDFGMNVQDAGDAARVRHFQEGLAVESGIVEPVREDLRARGHHLLDGRGLMGGYQAARLDAAADGSTTAVLHAGSDPRKDGMAAGW